MPEPAIFITAVYPLVLTVVMVVAVVTGWGRRFEGPDGAESHTPTMSTAEPTTACVAMPISDGSHVGSLGVSVPAGRLSQVEHAADTLIATGKRVSRALALSG